MFVIPDELKEFLESGVAVIVGTADDQGRPHLGFVWGLRVHDDRTAVTIFIESARAEPTLGDLRANGRIAVTAASPVSYRSIQLKGRSTAIGQTDEADRARVQRHRDAFMTETALVGDSPAVIRNVWMEGDVIRVDVDVERAFDQTPGADAGNPL